MYLRTTVRRSRGGRTAARASGVFPEPLESRKLFASIIWSETFDGLPLGPRQEETAEAAVDPTHVWTDTPPAGWVNDDTGVPGYNNAPDNNGVTEWIGWAFPRGDWWSQAAEDQNRSSFVTDPGARARGNVMVADPDEWDDQAHPGKPNWADASQLYDAVITTGNIPISGVVAGTTMFEFDSSWRPEALDDGPVGQRVNNQTGIIEVLYPDGTSAELIHWDSIEGSPFYKDDRTQHWNEHVAVPLTLPAGVTSIKLRITMGNAANDWWWAVDNLAVTGNIDYSNIRLIAASGSDGTGAQAANNETLWEVAYPTGAATTQILKLPSIPDGDAIGFNPDTGLLHHISGGTSFSDDPTDPRYRDNHVMETFDVVDGNNARVAVFNANAQQFGPAGPRPTFVLPATRRTDAQTDPSFGFEARGPGEYWAGQDLVWSDSEEVFYLIDQSGLYKLTAGGVSTFVGDPGLSGDAPAGLTFFNVGGQRLLLMAKYDGLYTINPATGQYLGTGVNLAYADGTPVGGILSLVEAPNSTALLGIAADPAAPSDPLRRDLVQINPLTGLVTPIGRFNVPVNDLAFVYAPAASQAVVSEVYVRGSGWQAADANPATTTFMEYLEAKGLGDDALGYRLYGNGAPTAGPANNPEQILPWINMDQIVVRYAAPPTGGGVPTPGTLTLGGQRNGNYTITSVAPVAGDPTAYVLTLGKPLGGGDPVAGTAPTGTENGDRITLSVPGAGAGGSSFSLGMKVVQGDVDHLNETAHNVLARDYAEVKKRFFKNSSQVPSNPDTDYTPFHDVDGNGQVLARDYAEVKKRFFQNLPAAPAAGASLDGSSITSQVFASEKILG